MDKYDAILNGRVQNFDAIINDRFIGTDLIIKNIPVHFYDEFLSRLVLSIELEDIGIFKYLTPKNTIAYLIVRDVDANSLKYCDFSSAMSIDFDAGLTEITSVDVKDVYMFLTSDVSIALTRLRLLSDMTGSTLGDYGDMSLSEVALITIDD